MPACRAPRSAPSTRIRTRVSPTRTSFGPSLSRAAALLSLLVATAASCYLAYFSVRLVYWSYKLHDVSQGQDVTPMWIAQAPLAAGAVLFAICIVDNLVTLLLRGRDNIRSENLEQSHAE